VASLISCSMTRQDDTKIDELMSEVKALREEIAPLVEIYTNSIGAYKTITWFLKLTAIIATGVGAILFLKKI
jgi:hypothetical protein